MTKQDEHYDNWELPNLAKPRAIPTLKELEEIRQAAQDEGQRQGYQQGLAQAQDEINAEKQKIAQVLQVLNEPLMVVSEVVEKDLVELCKHVMQALLKREYEQKPEELLGVIKRARAELMQPSLQLVIHMNPEDIACVRNAASANDLVNCQLVEDQTLGRGDCMVNTDQGRMDATLYHRIEALVSESLASGVNDE